MYARKSDNLRASSWMDSGLVVVVCIIISMVVSVFFVLFYVQYEWCHVLFNNFTVSIVYFSFTPFSKEDLSTMFIISAIYIYRVWWVFFFYIKKVRTFVSKMSRLYR